MNVRIIDQEQVARLLPMSACMNVMETALSGLHRGEVTLPLRSIMWMPEKKGALGLMPASMETPKALGVKVVSVFPSNSGTPYDSHQGVVLLYETENGRLISIMDASEITAVRTAAVSGSATKRLANREAGDLAILGSGVQARTHLEAMSIARKLRRVRVWSPNSSNREAFAKRESIRLKMDVEAMDSAKDAVLDADIICTVTASIQPILKSDWVRDGAHINAVGSSVSFARELDSALMARGRIFVDRRESTLNESGDYLFAKEENAIDEQDIVEEIGALFHRDEKGRTDPEQVTIFKSLGLAIEDLAAAHYVYEQAIAKEIGTEIFIGGSRRGD